MSDDSQEATGVITSPHSERGATAVEYAFMAGLIAVVIAAAVGAFGQAVIALFAIPATVWP